MGKIKKATRKFFQRQQRTKTSKKPQPGGKHFKGKGTPGRGRGEQNHEEATEPEAQVKKTSAPVRTAESSEYTREGLQRFLGSIPDDASAATSPLSKDEVLEDFFAAYTSIVECHSGAPCLDLIAKQIQDALVGNGARKHGGAAVVTREVVEALRIASPAHAASLRALVAVWAVAVETVSSDGRPGPVSAAMDVTIGDAAALQHALTAGLAALPPLFDEALDITLEAKAKRPVVPSRSKAWASASGAIHVACRAAATLAAVRPDAMAALIPFVPYIACFLHLRNTLLKAVHDALLAGDESAGQQAYFLLKAVAVLSPYPTAAWCLRTAYWAYVGRCEAAGTGFCPWLADGVRELFALDPFLAYQHAFVYVRDMALAVHAAVTATDNDAKAALFSDWSFVSQLRLWAFLIGSHDGAEDSKEPTLSALAYPLIQLASNAARLAVGRRLLPARLHCAAALVGVARADDVYVPAAPVVLEALDSGLFYARPRQSTDPVPPLDSLLEAEPHLISDQPFREAVLALSLALLLDHYKACQDDASFPECAQVAITKLKKFIQDVKDPRLVKLAKSLADKLAEQCKYVSQKRGAVAFNAKGRDGPARVAPMKKGPLANYTSAFVVA